jgi:hypothetical protein
MVVPCGGGGGGGGGCGCCGCCGCSMWLFHVVDVVVVFVVVVVGDGVVDWLVGVGGVQIVDCILVYSLIEHFCKTFSELDIELILIILRRTTFSCTLPLLFLRVRPPLSKRVESQVFVSGPP